MSAHDRYRAILLRSELPPLQSRARRRLVTELRFHVGRSIWMHASPTPPASLPELVQHARELGPAWSW